MLTSHPPVYDVSDVVMMRGGVGVGLVAQTVGSWWEAQGHVGQFPRA